MRTYPHKGLFRGYANQYTPAKIKVKLNFAPFP